MNAARRQPAVIDLWRKRVPIVMYLLGVCPSDAPAKDREDGRLFNAIMDSDDCGPEAIAIKTHMALEFMEDHLISDLEYRALASIVRPLLAHLPRDLVSALEPFVASKYCTRHAHETWLVGAEAAFPEIAQALAKARGKAA